MAKTVADHNGSKDDRPSILYCNEQLIDIGNMEAARHHTYQKLNDNHLIPAIKSKGIFDSLDMPTQKN